MKIDQVKEHIKYWNNILELLHEPINETDNVDTIIYKKYLEEDNVNSVMKYVNERGYRVISSDTGKPIVYKSTDISKVLTNKSAEVEQNLKETVQKLYIMSNKKHKKIQ